MENDFSSARADRQGDATTLLGDLESDRVGLVERLRKPAWFPPSLGALAAIYISTPALPDTVNRGLVLIPLILGGILLVLRYQQVTGIRLLRFRVVEGLLLAGAVLVTLLFFSVSLGLAASGFPGWILACVLVGFLAVTGIALLLASSMRGRVLDVE